jgi:hypothetical protein
LDVDHGYRLLWQITVGSPQAQDVFGYLGTANGVSAASPPWPGKTVITNTLHGLDPASPKRLPELGIAQAANRKKNYRKRK